MFERLSHSIEFSDEKARANTKGFVFAGFPPVSITTSFNCTSLYLSAIVSPEDSTLYVDAYWNERPMTSPLDNSTGGYHKEILPDSRHSFEIVDDENGRVEVFVDRADGQNRITIQGLNPAPAV